MIQKWVSVLTVAILFSFGLTGTCLGSPTKPTPAPSQETTTTATTKSPVAAERADNTNNVTKKPRCLSSLFGGLFGDDYYEPMLPDYNPGPPVPYATPGGGIFPGSGFGGSPFAAPPPTFGGISGLGFRGTQAYEQGVGMESQLYSAQAQINSQLSGVPSSGMYPRHVGAGLTYLPPPPTLFYR